MQPMAITMVVGVVFGLMATVISAPTSPFDASDSTALVPSTPTFSAPAPVPKGGADDSTELFQYSETAQSVHDIINCMAVADDGYAAVGEDGVARSYAGNGTVIDYRKLSNSQLAEYATSLPPSVQEYQAEYAELFANVSGLDVDDSQLMNPSTALAPPTGSSDAERYVKAMSSNGMACSTTAACHFMGCGACAPIHVHNQYMYVYW